MALNESVLKMTLNAENRERFKGLILKDAFQTRSRMIYEDFVQVVKDAAELTWGKTPQARSATKKALSKLRADAKKLTDKGVTIGELPKFEYSVLHINCGGQLFECVVRSQKLNEIVIVDFDNHLLDSYNNRADHNYRVVAASKTVHLTADHPIAKRLMAIKDECDELGKAAEELTAIINTVFGKSRTLGMALEKWDGLEYYVPMILSSCKELVVAGPVIDQRIKALREAKVPVKKAMSIGEAA